ncbi:MAG: hypothetical protein M9884_13395 [Rhodocyclaceae bacterium]|nr:hypothetical protein [Rhodocyclaceae bacterium]
MPKSATSASRRGASAPQGLLLEQRMGDARKIDGQVERLGHVEQGHLAFDGGGHRRSLGDAARYEVALREELDIEIARGMLLHLGMAEIDRRRIVTMSFVPRSSRRRDRAYRHCQSW